MTKIITYNGIEYTTCTYEIETKLDHLLEKEARRLEISKKATLNKIMKLYFQKEYYRGDQNV